jgi:carbon-monoxide dehydrogenase small subunit
MNLSVEVNGVPTSVEVEPRELLAHVLRDVLQLPSVHVACDTSTCGACTVLLDNVPVKSCAVLGVMAGERAVTTAEGLSDDAQARAISDAIGRDGVLPCGYCAPAVLLVARALLRHNARPSAEEVRRGLSGTMCRCTGYEPVVEVILAVANGANSATEAGVA